MAERKPVQTETLSQADLESLKKKLGAMSVTAVLDFYRSAYGRCKLDGDHAPAARAIQELVTVWREVSGSDASVFRFVF